MFDWLRRLGRRLGDWATAPPAASSMRDPFADYADDGRVRLPSLIVPPVPDEDLRRRLAEEEATEAAEARRLQQLEEEATAVMQERTGVLRPAAADLVNADGQLPGMLNDASFYMVRSPLDSYRTPIPRFAYDAGGRLIGVSQSNDEPPVQLGLVVQGGYELQSVWPTTDPLPNVQAVLNHQNTSFFPPGMVVQVTHVDVRPRLVSYRVLATGPEGEQPSMSDWEGEEVEALPADDVHQVILEGDIEEIEWRHNWINPIVGAELETVFVNLCVGQRLFPLDRTVVITEVRNRRFRTERRAEQYPTVSLQLMMTADPEEANATIIAIRLRQLRKQLSSLLTALNIPVPDGVSTSTLAAQVSGEVQKLERRLESPERGLREIPLPPSHPPRILDRRRPSGPQ